MTLFKLDGWISHAREKGGLLKDGKGEARRGKKFDIGRSRKKSAIVGGVRVRRKVRLWEGKE